MFDKELSLAVRKRMGSHIRTSQCWANAFKSVTMDETLSDCFYIEGWATMEDNDDEYHNPPSVIGHGWIETLDGKIIDPTFADQDVTVCYFAGLKYSKDERAKLSKKAKELPFYASIHHYHSPEYTTAFNQAWDYSNSRVR